ncbi:hypothetical protein [Thaumasiovibrio subtropicus]|uniref:hypothetical protein n=1 Tax=Thaumasiovibrio subtropicus TaxID=1891207 RepID=UPI000B35F608|nr:hypothetical protein [Thaumasiovibrio subtropicus]
MRIVLWGALMLASTAFANPVEDQLTARQAQLERLSTELEELEFEVTQARKLLEEQRKQSLASKEELQALIDTYAAMLKEQSGADLPAL